MAKMRDQEEKVTNLEMAKMRDQEERKETIDN